MTGDWLNGWNRHGATVIVGNGVHCAGCGKDQGIVTVDLSDAGDWDTRKVPDWPFLEGDCPICQLEAELAKYPQDKLTARMAALAKLREPAPLHVEKHRGREAAKNE